MREAEIEEACYIVGLDIDGFFGGLSVVHW
jgi:hypothetical protein